MRNTLIIIISFVSLAITLVVAELLISKFLPQPTLNNLLTNTPRCYSKSDYLPFALQPDCSTQIKTAEFDMPITINSHGYRDDELTQAKSPDTFRIVIVGDSFVFGYGVKSEQTFAKILQTTLTKATNKYKKIEVINAGFASAFSPDSYYLFLQHNLKLLQPNVVIFSLFVLNDITDMKDHTTWTKIDTAGLPLQIIDKTRQVNPQGYLANREQPWYYRVKVLSNSHAFILSAKTLNTLSQKIRARIFSPQPTPGSEKTALDYYLCLFTNQCFPEMEKLFSQTFKLIIASQDFSVANSSEFLLLLLPADVQIDPTAWEKYQAGRFGLSDPPYPQTRFRDFATQNNISYIDLLDTFLEHKSEKLFFTQDGHFTPRGHQLAGEFLGQFIAGQFLISP